MTAGKNNIAIATDQGAFNIDKMVFTVKNGGNTNNNTSNNNTSNNNNTSSNNTITNSIINNIISNNNSSVNDFIENNDKLPQTGRSFGLKDLLQIIIVLSIIIISILIIRDNKCKKAKKE